MQKISNIARAFYLGVGGVGVWGGARVVRYRMPCLVEGNLFSPSQVALHVVRGEA